MKVRCVDTTVSRGLLIAGHEYEVSPDGEYYVIGGTSWGKDRFEIVPGPIVPIDVFEIVGDIPPVGNLKAVQALKDGKPRISLFPVEAIRAIAVVLTEGATRYLPWNWLKEPAPWSVYLDALRRHLDAWAVRDDDDARTGFSHLAHAGANLMILLTLSIRGLGEDDRQP